MPLNNSFASRRLATRFAALAIMAASASTIASTADAAGWRGASFALAGGSPFGLFGTNSADSLRQQHRSDRQWRFPPAPQAETPETAPAQESQAARAASPM